MRFPLWMKILAGGWTAVLIPVYWHHYGPANYLWFSDIALFAAVANLWLANRLLASVTALIVAIPETVWIVDFLLRLALGAELLGMAHYMFDDSRPLYLRGLSLFHLWMPPLAIYQAWKLGYDRRAFRAATALAWVVLPLTWLVTDPQRNINWVYGPFGESQQWMPPLAWVGLMMALFPLAIYLPPHLLFRRIWERSDPPDSAPSHQP
jgi:hypothetical protein